MSLDSTTAYAALRARDARFDGRFFVGVTSTGVYCRPVCSARTPRAENCRFFANAAVAESHGFRPCLRCRPELAPGLALIDSPQALALQAARMIERATLEGRDIYVGAIASRLGVTDRHLRRIFQHAHGVSPIDYLSTRRLLLAKQLLTDTALPVTQVALASGFSSVRRFNASFAARYRLNPSALRRAALSPNPAASALVVRLGYRPPYDVDAMLRFIAARQVAGVESVDSTTWQRTLAGPTAETCGWFSARFRRQQHDVELHVAPSLVPSLGTVVQRVRHALDLDADPSAFTDVLAKLPTPSSPGLRVANGIDGFESAVRVILGQQVTVAGARTLTRRLVERFGAPIETPHRELTRLFPSAADIADASPAALGELGIVRQRVQALQALAREVAADRIALNAGAPLAPTLDALRALPGIGEWTAQMIAMRALAWPDAYPASDVGVLKALGTRDANVALERAQAWRPWRAYAVMALWQSLEKTQ